MNIARPTAANPPPAHALYEAAVQGVDFDIETLEMIYRHIRRSKATTLREDFCGTFLLAATWVKAAKENRALALDINPSPLAYGKKQNWLPLTESERARLSPMKKTVFSRTKPVDIIAAFNFSFSIIKKRQELLKYFKLCHSSLQKRGLLVMDLIGGYEVEQHHMDRHRFSLGGKRYTYLWEQVDFNPITRDILFHIHFEYEGKRIYDKAFQYNWRLWTVPELRELLLEAGFSSTAIFWQGDDGDFFRTEKEPNDPCWLAYVVGVK